MQVRGALFFQCDSVLTLQSLYQYLHVLNVPGDPLVNAGLLFRNSGLLLFFLLGGGKLYPTAKQPHHFLLSFLTISPRWLNNHLGTPGVFPHRSSLTSDLTSR